jgi:hypothetical protein
VKIGLYRERVEAAQSDPRRRWAAIRDVLRQTEPPDILPNEECQRLCDGFAKYFIEKIQLIKAAIRSKLADFESIPLLTHATLVDTTVTAIHYRSLQINTVDAS